MARGTRARFDLFAKGMRERGSVDPRFAERVPPVKRAPGVAARIGGTRPPPTREDRYGAGRAYRDEMLSRHGGRNYREKDLPVPKPVAQPPDVKSAAKVEVPEERVRVVRGYPVRGKELEALEARERKLASFGPQRGAGPGETVTGRGGKSGHWVQIAGRPVFIED